MMGECDDGEVARGDSVAPKGFVETETDVPDEGPGEASAEKNDCETSERRTDARFWLFVKVSPFCSSSHLRPTLLPTLSIHDETGCTARAPMPGIDGGGSPEDKLMLERFPARAVGAGVMG